MKTADTQLVTFFNTATQAYKFDLWTINLQSGTQLRWTDADIDIRLPDARTFTRGPIITRDRVQWVRGIQVDQMRAKFSGPDILVDGKALPGFAAAGGFDGASVLLERVYMNDSGVAQGSLTWFLGIAADAYPSRMGVDLVVKSQLFQLSQQIPRNLYQASCLNDLYDANCAASRSVFTYAGEVVAVASGANPAITVTYAPVSLGARFLELGATKFATGANAGIGRTVQAQGGQGVTVNLQFARPFPFTVAVGDEVYSTAGCDKLQATCDGKFGNLARFRGLPYVPVPETAT